MKILSNIFITLVALLHIWFLVLEMFLWQQPIGLKTFAMTAEVAAQSATLAANQGLYNGFLAAGLLFALLHKNQEIGYQFKLFFLGCVIVAGAYGAATAKFSILFIQALPAVIAFALCFLANKKEVATE